jgi:hypothetical protein
MPMQEEEASKTPSKHDQSRTSAQHIIVKTSITGNKEIILNAIIKKGQIT